MAVFAIGDVHGCANSLDQLLELISFEPARDQLWFCGDLVNRGPDSLAMLRRVRDLGSQARVVLGNHDLALLAVAEGYVKPRRKDTFDEVLRASDCDELLNWLRHQPLVQHDADLGLTMVHAGLPPQWDLPTTLDCASEVESVLRSSRYREFLAVMYGNKPSRWNKNLSGDDRLRFITNALTRIRFCTLKGELSFSEKGPPGSQAKGLHPWYAVPDRRSAGLPIIAGHWAALGCHNEAGVYALDSGCAWGGRLTALRLDGTQRGSLFSVACGDPWQ